MWFYINTTASQGSLTSLEPPTAWMASLWAAMKTSVKLSMNSSFEKGYYCVPFILMCCADAFN